MAKHQCTIAAALLLCTLGAVAAAPAPVAPAASGGALYNCRGVQAIGTSATSNLCCQLCGCLGLLNKSFSGAGLQAFCKQQCGACVAAGNSKTTCPTPASPLPDVCAKGLKFNSNVAGLVDQCVATYVQDRTALKKVQGC